MKSPSYKSRKPDIEVVFVGGTGEFGMNMMVIKYGKATLLIDAGSLFPSPELHGVDLIIPDNRALHSAVGNFSAVVLTHGHEDHIGALPFLWDLIDGPIYGTQLTLALLRSRLAAQHIDPTDRLVPVVSGETTTVGQLSVEFIQVTHSMPGCLAVAVHTPLGVLVHTGDFKFDSTPIDDKPTDQRRLAALGTQGVLALFSDSTNASRSGKTPSEVDILPAFKALFSSTHGRIVVTTFSSSLHRIQLLVNLAVEYGRKVVFLGRGIRENVATARSLNLLTIPSNIEISEAEISLYKRELILCVVTGSQGQPSSALARIAAGTHRSVNLEFEDIVVFSSRIIPGNERSIGQLVDLIVRQGAQCITEEEQLVHVSGHGSKEDLALMLSLLKPRNFAPIHGEYRYLVQHAAIAREICGRKTNIFLEDRSHRIYFDQRGAWNDGPIPLPRVLLDKSRTRAIAKDLVYERNRLRSSGVVVPIIAIRRKDGAIVGSPKLVTSGFGPHEATHAIIEALPEVIRNTRNTLSSSSSGNNEQLSELLRVELRRFCRRELGQIPIILPVIMEI